MLNANNWPADATRTPLVGSCEHDHRSPTTTTPYNAFDVNFDFTEDAGLLSGMPFALLTEETGLLYPDGLPGCVMNASLANTDDNAHATSTATDTITSNSSIAGMAVNRKGPGDAKVASPLTQQSGGHTTNSGASTSPISSFGAPRDAPSSGSGSGTASECGSTGGKPSSSSCANASSASGGRNKNFFERITCLPEYNFNVLTPDKHVMLSIPAKYIVPTNGSRNYLRKNRGAPCTADDMNTNSHGNTVPADASCRGSASAAKEKKMFFSFCLCKAYSVVGGHCHHGNECDFIHCMPERLPQVVSTDSGSIIDEIIGKKEKGNVSSDNSSFTDSALPSAQSKPVLGTDDTISTFQVHWSTPVSSLDAAPYARLPAGQIIYIKKDSSRNNLQAIPSELIYKTVGGVEALRGCRSGGGGPHPGDARTPLRICKHFEREKCARGPLCYFIHPVVMAESGEENNFTAFVAHQREQQAHAQELLARSQQQVEQQQQQMFAARMAAAAAGSAPNAFPAMAGSGSGQTSPARQDQKSSYCLPPTTFEPPPPPPPQQQQQQQWRAPAVIPQPSWLNPRNTLPPCPPNAGPQPHQILPASQSPHPSTVNTTEQLLALLAQMSSAANATDQANTYPINGYSNNNNAASAAGGGGGAMYVVQNPDGTLLIIPSGCGERGGVSF